MIYDIRLSIRYDYDRPALEGRHHLRLHPMQIPGVQQVETMRLDVTPEPTERAVFRDFFGNEVTEVVLSGGHLAVAFELQTRVLRYRPGWDRAGSSALAELAQEVAGLRSLAAESPHHFLGPSPRIEADRAIEDHARAAVEGAGSVVDAVEALGRQLHRDMVFDDQATTVDTAPAEAFARGRGVCQDFAQVMIAGLRAIGIPAGYVSGFLRTVPPPGEARLEGADAMHAWVRAWAGAGIGWVEYDPTNALFVADSHVTLATGRDYGDVSPVSGILRSSGSQSSHQAVDVIAQGGAGQEFGQIPAGR